MVGFLIQRLVQAAGVMLAMTVIVFFGVYAIGNPIDVLIMPGADQAMRSMLMERYGLDLPLWRQYLVFLNNIVHGDLGTSFQFNISALQLILSRLPATMELALSAMVIGTVLGVPLGMWAGYRPESASAKAIMAFSILGFSVPTFWVGLILILAFAVELGWLPSGGRGETVSLLGVDVSFLTVDGLRHLLLPALNLALFKLSLLIRLTRAGMREVLLTDYVKFARAEGLLERRILLVHVLKNIAIPIVTVFGLELGSTIAFAVVTETIFSWPGTGKLIIDSISALDRPVLVAYLTLIVFVFILINLAVDLVYAGLDPRIRQA